MLLIVAPWTAWWRRNFFAEALPWMAVLMSSAVVRWGVVLAGIITLLGGLREVRALFSHGRS